MPILQPVFKTFKAHRLYCDPVRDRWLGKANNLTASSASETPADHDMPPSSFGENSMEMTLTITYMILQVSNKLCSDKSYMTIYLIQLSRNPI